MSNSWILVSDSLPDYSDFVWVKRADGEICLGYFNKGMPDYHIEHSFESAHGVGDTEGLNQEIYPDVIEWQALAEPLP